MRGSPFKSSLGKSVRPDLKNKLEGCVCGFSVRASARREFKTQHRQQKMPYKVHFVQ
jgi:hypothetical protein